MDIRYLNQAGHDALTKAKRVLIVAHKKPDGDTLGASAAMFNFCRQEGIAATAFCRDVIPEQYLFIPGTADYTADEAVFSAGSGSAFGGNDTPFDLLAMFDAGDLRFAGIADLVAAMPRRPFILNFDHHATNERFGDVNILDVTASSTAEVVYNFFRDCGKDIDRPIATCLLTGILTDTGNFSNPATSRSCLAAASDLLRRGGKIQEVSNRLMRNKSMESLRLWGDVLSRLKYNEKLGVASTVIFNKDLEREGVDDEHVEGVSNFLNNFLDVKIVLVLKELPDGMVKGSFRSSEDIDVSLIAKVLGGGGHKKAAGFTVPGRVIETPEGWKVVD